jgi:hypothetical protein
MQPYILKLLFGPMPRNTQTFTANMWFIFNLQK